MTNSLQKTWGPKLERVALNGCEENRKRVTYLRKSWGNPGVVAELIAKDYIFVVEMVIHKNVTSENGQDNLQFAFLQ